MTSTTLLIKGYLPVRLKLPDTPDGRHDETFFFVREHQSSSKDKTATNSPTLFVANAPVVQGVSTKVLLTSIFGRYAEVTRVTVVSSPRQPSGTPTTEKLQSSVHWSKIFRYPSSLPPIISEGKFAHVVFSSSKHLKKTLKALTESMKKYPSSAAGLEVDPLEIQTLADESLRQERSRRQKELGSDDDDITTNQEDTARSVDSKRGILKVAARYRARCFELSRENIMAECNRVMQAYEEAEEAKRRALEAAKNQPDDDGFVTVSYSTAVGSKTELEDTTAAQTPSRRKGKQRSRKKKESIGAQEQTDFYRFQRRENKKRTLEDLRSQFEEDLNRVKRLKEENKYKPF